MRGLPGTAMPAFGTTLSRADLIAVITYVASLNGIANPSINLGPGPGAAGPPEAALSAEAERGRALFFDAVRGFGRCSTCHEVNGIGISVTTPYRQDSRRCRGAARACDTGRPHGHCGRRSHARADREPGKDPRAVLRSDVCAAGAADSGSEHVEGRRRQRVAARSR